MLVNLNPRLKELGNKIIDWINNSDKEKAEMRSMPHLLEECVV